MENNKEFNFKPLRTQVVIKLIPPVDTTESGIFIPSSMQDAPITGVIMAVGPGTKKFKMETKPGDVVLFGQRSGNTIEIDGEEYIRQLEANVLGIISREND